MRRRDRQNEIVVALIVTVAMAFALALSILLTLGGQDNDRNDTASATAFATLRTEEVGVAPTQLVTTEDLTADVTESVTETSVPDSATPPSAITTQEVAATEEVRAETITETAVAVATETAEVTETSEVTDSDVPTATDTLHPLITRTFTPENQTEAPSATATPSSTNTMRPTRTFTAVPTDTPSYTPTATRTPRPTATDTVIPSPTRTPRPTRTLSPTPSRTPTRTHTITPAPTYTTIMLMLPSPTACVVVQEWDAYTVQRGDTLFSIAQRAGISIAEMAVANCISNTALIFAGQTLFVPPDSLSNMPLVDSGGSVNPADAGVVQCTNASAQITNPEPGAQLDGVVTLFGMADGANFGRYVLGWRPDIPGEPFRVFEERYQPTRSVLGQINTDLLPQGLAWFSLTVLDQQGAIIGECAIRMRFQ